MATRPDLTSPTTTTQELALHALPRQVIIHNCVWRLNQISTLLGNGCQAMYHHVFCNSWVSPQTSLFVSAVELECCGKYDAVDFYVLNRTEAIECDQKHA
jgi:hypothetical protein